MALKNVTVPPSSRLAGALAFGKMATGPSTWTIPASPGELQAPTAPPSGGTGVQTPARHNPADNPRAQAPPSVPQALVATQALTEVSQTPDAHAPAEHFGRHSPQSQVRPTPHGCRPPSQRRKEPPSTQLGAPLHEPPPVVPPLPPPPVVPVPPPLVEPPGPTSFGTQVPTLARSLNAQR